MIKLYLCLLVNINMALEFQIYDYSEGHEEVESDSEEKYKLPGDYIIHVFGRTEDDKSVYAKVTGFTPYFYIELPSSWESNKKSEIKRNSFRFNSS